MYYRGAAAAIIVYDITRPNTFNTLKNWVEELKSKGPKDICIAIAGNKADLAHSREVDKAMAVAYADEIKALYIETSAKDDLNVANIFSELTAKLPSPSPNSNSDIIRATQGLQTPRNNKSKSSCC